MSNWPAISTTPSGNDYCTSPSVARFIRPWLRRSASPHPCPDDRIVTRPVPEVESGDMPSWFAASVLSRRHQRHRFEDSDIRPHVHGEGHWTMPPLLSVAAGGDVAVGVVSATELATVTTPWSGLAVDWSGLAVDASTVRAGCGPAIADDVAAALGRAFTSPRRSSALAKPWRRKNCCTRSRSRLRNAARMFRWSSTRRIPGRRAFDVRLRYPGDANIRLVALGARWSCGHWSSTFGTLASVGLIAFGHNVVRDWYGDTVDCRSAVGDPWSHGQHALRESQGWLGDW